MKKIIAALAALMVMLASVSLAEDLSSLSDDDLMELYMRVTEELANRKRSDREETTEDEPHADQTPGPADEMPEISDSTVLYYNPEGGQYYHLDRNCRRVHPKYLPLSDNFTYAELGEDQYKDLKPCEICAAPAPREELPPLADFREAVDAAGESAVVGGDMDHLIVVMEKDGRYIRMVAMLDDHAKELYLAALEAEDPENAFEAFDAYAWSLPVSYTEEFTVMPKGQPELDALAGKTISELETEGYSIYGSGGGENLPTVVTMAYGFYNYDFEVNASFDEYLEHQDRNDLESLTVKNGKYAGPSIFALNLDYHADGTREPQTGSEMSAEEYDRMIEIADILGAAWENGEPDQEARKALIAELTEKFPESEDMIRQMVETYHVGISPDDDADTEEETTVPGQ